MILVEIIVLVSWIVIAGVQNAIDTKFDFSGCDPIMWHNIKVSCGSFPSAALTIHLPHLPHSPYIELFTPVHCA
jgi:hypothetical protein